MCQICKFSMGPIVTELTVSGSVSSQRSSGHGGLGTSGTIVTNICLTFIGLILARSDHYVVSHEEWQSATHCRHGWVDVTPYFHHCGNVCTLASSMLLLPQSSQTRHLQADRDASSSLAGPGGWPPGSFLTGRRSRNSSWPACWAERMESSLHPCHFQTLH